MFDITRNCSKSFFILYTKLILKRLNLEFRIYGLGNFPIMSWATSSTLSLNWLPHVCLCERITHVGQHDTTFHINDVSYNMLLNFILIYTPILQHIKLDM